MATAKNDPNKINSKEDFIDQIIKLANQSKKSENNKAQYQEEENTNQNQSIHNNNNGFSVDVTKYDNNDIECPLIYCTSNTKLKSDNYYGREASLYYSKEINKQLTNENSEFLNNLSDEDLKYFNDNNIKITASNFTDYIINYAIDCYVNSLNFSRFNFVFNYMNISSYCYKEFDINYCDIKDMILRIFKGYCKIDVKDIVEYQTYFAYNTIDNYTITSAQIAQIICNALSTATNKAIDDYVANYSNNTILENVVSVAASKFKDCSSENEREIVAIELLRNAAADTLLNVVDYSVISSTIDGFKRIFMFGGIDVFRNEYENRNLNQ